MSIPRSFPIAVIWILVLMLAAPAPISAQDEQGSPNMFSQAQLDQMLAPIALYPDALLAQILMASTYPIEVVTADRWVKQNRDLQGDRLNDALEDQTWDASVKALVPFPDILSMMSAELNWTQMVGDAFLAQESDVMDSVQRLRRRAYEADNLRSSEKEQVTVEDDSIWIEPTNPEVVFIPTYDPTWIYGPWWWPGYPPYVIYPYWPGVVISPGFITFGVGCFVGASWGHVWGHWDWRHRRVFVNENRNININRRNIDASHLRTTPWMHDPVHRRGVPYLGPSVRERFRQVNPGAIENRRPFRGFDRTPGGAPSGVEKRPSRTISVSGGTERKSGGAISAPGVGPEPPGGRTGRPGALMVPDREAGKIGTPGAVTPPSTPQRTVNRTPVLPMSRPASGGEKNMDAFRGIGQGGEVRRQSSWGATVHPGAPAGGPAPGGIPSAGVPGGGGATRSGESTGGARGGPSGHGSGGGRR